MFCKLDFCCVDTRVKGSAHDPKVESSNLVATTEMEK